VGRKVGWKGVGREGSNLKSDFFHTRYMNDNEPKEVFPSIPVCVSCV